MFLYIDTYVYVYCNPRCSRIRYRLVWFVLGKYLYLLSMKTKLYSDYNDPVLGNVGIRTSGGRYSFQPSGSTGGLSSNEITCILERRKGFMWLGTTSGVNRFDGYEFKHYKYKESGFAF